MDNTAAVPVKGCWVRRFDAERKIGIVAGAAIRNGRVMVDVQWFDQTREIVAPDELRSAFQRGYIVQDVPSSPTKRTLGPGTVLAARRLAEKDQVLVQLHEDGRVVWLPYENLRRIMGPELQYRRGEMLAADAGERVALNLMAHALRTWNEATGALDRVDVDPLPHHIHVAHRILASGHTDWIIADDAGLGRTMEVGLLLAGLERRRRLRRVLIVCPASLARQWQDELKAKFNSAYEIYGHDFFIDAAWKWHLHDRVIAALDLIKPRGPRDPGDAAGSHFSKLLLADGWDLVIFDEAHRLSRLDDGAQPLRYRLARSLREKGQGLLLLTATPHQGDPERFRTLLQLVRPDLSRQIAEIETSPEIVGDIVLRNRTIDVVDADGEFVFHGQTVRRVPIAATPDALELDRELSAYFRDALQAAETLGGSRARAIGFTVTAYRKLASSSAAALKTALERRVRKLSSPSAFLSGGRYVQLDDVEEDIEDIDRVDVSEGGAAFFDSEADVLRDIISLCDAVLADDAKLQELRNAVRSLKDSGRKPAIFTEYRATQDYIVEHLAKELGEPIAVINAAQSLGDKLKNVRAFEGQAPAIVCTEAGGEGPNLHRGCHVILNYDLPWNPARLAQRIGRIYRYGQSRKAIVLNFHAVDTVENQVIAYALDRSAALARDIDPVGSESQDRYEAETLGGILEQLDIADILDNAREAPAERTKERIEEAVLRAQQAHAAQAAVLAHAQRFDADGLQRLGAFTTAHLAEFICRAAQLVEIAVDRDPHDPERFVLRLPERLRAAFPEFGARPSVEATTRRQLAVAGGPQLLDFSTAFVRYLVEQMTTPAAGGGYAAINRDDLGVDTIAGFIARWQNDQGAFVGEELHVAARFSDGRTGFDNRTALRLFEGASATARPPALDPNERKSRFEALTDSMEAHMAAETSAFRHPNSLAPVAVAEITTQAGNAANGPARSTYQDDNGESVILESPAAGGPRRMPQE